MLDESSTILSLSVELLIKIFLLVVHQDRIALPVNREQHARSISQVCRLWRLIALESRSLWATVIQPNGQSRLWLNELLRRSGSQPLDVAVHFKFTSLQQDEVSPALSLVYSNTLHVLDQLRRIRSLDLKHSERPMLLAILDKLRPPAPLLETLKIQFCSHFNRLPSRLILFGGQAPNLRTIIIAAEAEVFFDITVFSQLTSLYVYPLVPQTTVVEWLQILQCLPMLERLHLEQAIMITENPRSLPCVKLPRLSYLSIDTDLRNCILFLSQIETRSPLETIALRCSRVFPGDSYAALFTIFDQRLSPASDVDLHIYCGITYFQIIRFSNGMHDAIFHLSWPDTVVKPEDFSPSLSSIITDSALTTASRIDLKIDADVTERFKDDIFKHTIAAGNLEKFVYNGSPIYPMSL